MKSYTDIQLLKPNIGHFPSLSESVLNGFSWGPDPKNMSFKFGEREEVLQNVKEFYSALNIEDLSVPVTLLPQLGDKIVDVTDNLLRRMRVDDGAFTIESDVVFTNIPGQVISIKQADCTTAIVHTILFGGESLVGLIHTGWRGVDTEVVNKSLKHMVDTYKVNLNSVKIGIAPHISKRNRSYEHIDGFSQAERWIRGGFLTFDGEMYYFDQGGCALKQYLDAGIDPDNIEFYEIDTFDEAIKGNTFSQKYHYNMEQKGIQVQTGRFIVAVENT